jgi:hypothetical protein
MKRALAARCAVLRKITAWVISGSADRIDGLHRTQPVYPNVRTRVGPAGWGQLWAE